MVSTNRKNYITVNSCQQLICPILEQMHWRPSGIAACAVLYHCSPFREAPQHGKRPRRDDPLERRIIGRHSLRLHNGGSYFGRRERPRA